MLKIKTKSEIFREAWQIAKAAALRWGGSARSFLAAALRSIYADLRTSAYRALDRVAKEAAINNGLYQVMATLNAPSITIVDQAIATVSAVVSKVVDKVSDIAVKALGLFRKVCDVSPVQEVALE
jgi:hypothetical protein